jgi:diaminopimelate decarboxylase
VEIREFIFKGFPLAREKGIQDSDPLVKNGILDSPPEFSVCYSVKANPSQAILRFFLEKGAIWRSARAESSARRLAPDVPRKNHLRWTGKNAAELELVLSRGIGEIHAEFDAGGRTHRRDCRAYQAACSIALRINLREVEGGAMRVGVGGNRLFAGSRILDFEILLDQYRKGLEIARRVAARLRRPVHTLDFGGGLGVPYLEHETELDTAKPHQEGLEALFEPLRENALFACPLRRRAPR